MGVVVALADKLETLVGMFGIGNLPTGDKDPFALRRHALGVIRILIEKDFPLLLTDYLGHARNAFNGLSKSDNEANLFNENLEKLPIFIFDRLAVNLRDQGFSAQEVDAVSARRIQKLSHVPKQLAAVSAFAALPEAPALAAANKRISNILKKAEGVQTVVNESLLAEPAEIALHKAMRSVVPKADAQFDSGDYTASLQTLAALRTPVDAFFEGVMVNADDLAVRANRLGLLAMLHAAMNRVADLSKLVA